MAGDWHIHSHFSNDSCAALEDIAEEALKKGLTDICITDHSDMDLEEDGWVQNIPEYTAALEEFRDRFKGRLDIHIGLEIGLNPDLKEQIEAHAASYPFEFILGSTHTMMGDDPYFRDRYDMDDTAFFMRYFERSLENVMAFEFFDCCAHLDYVVRYGYNRDRDYSYEKYKGPIDALLEILVKRGTALEVNTAGLRKGLEFIHPYPAVLETYKKMGGRRISLGSDAHKAADVAADFDAARKELYRLGFDEEDTDPLNWLRRQH